MSRLPVQRVKFDRRTRQAIEDLIRQIMSGGGGGGGDVTGPASSGDNAVARFNGTTGKIIQTSGVTISDDDDIASARDVSASGKVSGETLESTVATGTSPLSVTSTTLVANLNADKLDGIEASGFVQTPHSIDDHNDVDTTTNAPSQNDRLEWDGSNWIPANPDPTFVGMDNSRWYTHPFIVAHQAEPTAPYPSSTVDDLRRFFNPMILRERAEIFRLAVEHGQSIGTGKKCEFAIYDSDGTSPPGGPGTLLWSSGERDLTDSSNRTAQIVPSAGSGGPGVLAPGLYWVAFAQEDANDLRIYGNDKHVYVPPGLGIGSHYENEPVMFRDSADITWNGTTNFANDPSVEALGQDQTPADGSSASAIRIPIILWDIA